MPARVGGLRDPPSRLGDRCDDAGRMGRSAL